MYRTLILPAIALVILRVASGMVHAEESLIGLPKPRNAERPGSVMLHGGGLVTDDVFDKFIELAGGKDARIVLVPSAGYRMGDYPDLQTYRSVVTSRYGSWARLKADGRIADFQFLTTDFPKDAEREAFVRPIELATGVWFSGGDQARLNYRYVGEFPTRTRFQTALLRVIEAGGIVGGTSAGTAALPEIMTLTTDVDDTTYRNKAIAAHGLGLFNQAIVEQHFSTRGGRLERFTDLLKDQQRLSSLARNGVNVDTMIGIAIEERSALLIRHNRLEVFGDEKSHVFLKMDRGRTLQWTELEPGEKLQLSTGPSQTIRLLKSLP